MGIEEFGEHQDFHIPQFPQSAFLQDPDAALKYSLELLATERTEEEELLAGLLDLFDVDKCPERYLPYLADLIGLPLRGDDLEPAKREQIKQAISWYKAKGMPLSFELVFKALGYGARVYELWTDGVECKRWDEILPDPYYCSDIPSGWNPHSRIDIEVEINLDIFFQQGFTSFLEFTTFVRERMEEVRPIHVLLRVIHFIFRILDQYPSVLLDDEVKGTVRGLQPDNWCSVYWAMCGIWHFPSPLADVERRGGDYIWRDDVIGILTIPPGTPTDGDRYIIGVGALGMWAGRDDEIAMWDGVGFTWVFEATVLTTAVWIKADLVEANWRWWHYAYPGTWTLGGALYEFPRAAPGPYFRECGAPFNGLTCGPADTVEGTGYFNSANGFEECFLHNGAIPIRDGTLRRDCREVLDRLEIHITPEEEFPSGDMDDSLGLAFHIPDSYGSVGDSLEIVQHQVFTISDNYFECFLHNNVIVFRDGTIQRDCSEIEDNIAISIDFVNDDIMGHTSAVEWDDPLVEWDASDTYWDSTLSDSLEIIQHPTP